MDNLCAHRRTLQVIPDAFDDNYTCAAIIITKMFMFHNIFLILESKVTVKDY